MAEREVTQDVMEMLEQLAELATQEAWYWRARIEALARAGVVRGKEWAPSDKEAWGHHVKLVDGEGATAGFVDVSDAQKIEPFPDRLTETDSAVKERDSEPGLMLDDVLTDEALTGRVESVGEREGRLGKGSEGWDEQLAVDNEFSQYLQDPLFARLVQQEGLVMDEQGMWVIPEDAPVLGEHAGERLAREEVLQIALDSGWEWDGMPGQRPVVDSEREVEFDAQKDSLVQIAGTAWMKVSESESALELDQGQLLSQGQAREIAVDKLGWDWVDSPDVEVDGSRPVVVSGAEVSVPEGTRAVLADEWAWADGAVFEWEDDARVEGAWSAFGETELTRGSTVPVGTVLEDSGVDAGELDRQYQHFFDENATLREAGWD